MKKVQLDPKLDITAYELALIIKYTHGIDHLGRHGVLELYGRSKWDEWEPEVKRHFKEIIDEQD